MKSLDNAVAEALRLTARRKASHVIIGNDNNYDVMITKKQKHFKAITEIHPDKIVAKNEEGKKIGEVQLKAKAASKSKAKKSSKASGDIAAEAIDKVEEKEKTE